MEAIRLAASGLGFAQLCDRLADQIGAEEAVARRRSVFDGVVASGTDRGHPIRGPEVHTAMR